MQQQIYVAVEDLTTEDNTNYLNNWNHGSKEQSTATNVNQKYQCRHNFIGPRFQGVKKLFVFWFKNNTVKTGNTEYFLPKV